MKIKLTPPKICYKCNKNFMKNDNTYFCICKNPSFQYKVNKNLISSIEIKISRSIENSKLYKLFEINFIKNHIEILSSDNKGSLLSYNFVFEPNILDYDSIVNKLLRIEKLVTFK